MKFQNVWQLAESLYSTTCDLFVTLCNEYCKYQSEFEEKHGYNIDEAPLNETEDFCQKYCDKCPFYWCMGCSMSDDSYVLIGEEKK